MQSLHGIPAGLEPRTATCVRLLLACTSLLPCALACWRSCTLVTSPRSLLLHARVARKFVSCVALCTFWRQRFWAISTDRRGAVFAGACYIRARAVIDKLVALITSFAFYRAVSRALVVQRRRAIWAGARCRCRAAARGFALRLRTVLAAAVRQIGACIVFALPLSRHV